MVRTPRPHRTGNFFALRSVSMPVLSQWAQSWMFCSGQARVSISGMWPYTSTPVGTGLPSWVGAMVADVAVLHLGQDEHGAKAVVRIELRGQLVCDVQAKAAAHGQAPAQAQVGDIAHLIARKTGILRGRDAAGGVLFQRPRT